MKNARFWVFINGSHVKLTVKPDVILRWERYERTDEGYSFCGESWALSSDGLVVIRETFSDGRDCDGRLETGHTAIASTDPFTFRHCYQFEGMRPDWKDDGPGWQRDEYAEAANY
jgi:hypothetical protein